MPYDGLGNFTRSYNFVADRDAAIKIQAVRMDGEFDNYATAMNAVLLRNGVAPMTGDLKMGNNDISGLAMGAEATPSLSVTGDVTTGMWFPAAGVIAFSIVGVERARLTNTGFQVTGLQGINTATPRTALDVVGFTSVRGIFEDATISATALTGAINIDAVTQSVVVYDANAVANWTFNVRGDGATTLNSLMGIGQSLTLAVEVPQGATAYYCTAITVDGAVPSQLKWFGGAPAAGGISGIDVYSITIIKKAAATFYVRASKSQVR